MKNSKNMIDHKYMILTYLLCLFSKPFLMKSKYKIIIHSSEYEHLLNQKIIL